MTTYAEQANMKRCINTAQIQYSIYVIFQRLYHYTVRHTESKRCHKGPACHETHVELLANTGQHRALSASLLKPLSRLKGNRVAWLISCERAVAMSFGEA